MLVKWVANSCRILFHFWEVSAFISFHSIQLLFHHIFHFFGKRNFLRHNQGIVVYRIDTTTHKGFCKGGIFSGKLLFLTLTQIYSEYHIRWNNDVDDRYIKYVSVASGGSGRKGVSGVSVNI